MKIEEVFAAQKAYFAKGCTIPVANRLTMLQRLYTAIQEHETQIAAALKTDLGKSETESYMCEIGFTLKEIRYQMRHLRRWAKGKRYFAGMANFPSRAFTVPEPYGSVLIISPWNYPFMLCMEPLAGALAAGNCCVVKPSELAPACSAVIARLLGDIFSPEYVAVVEGGREENLTLLELRFDYIFFTGGTKIGKLVMQKAAANLTPVTLELGGKTPCVVTEDCDIPVAAARLVYGKYLNCGQTCVAPDYVLVDKRVQERFLKEVKLQIENMFGKAPLENADWGHIVNQKHFERLKTLIDAEKIYFGGQTKEETLQIAPTVLNNVAEDDPVMQQEIFGPIMPVLPYETIEQAEQFICTHEKPLALYLFTKSREVEHRFLRYVPFGGGCVNDTIAHITTSNMGFGGVGASGMGSYHGKKSFDTFSHEKSILKKGCWLDPPMRYQPYSSGKLEIIRKFLK